MSLLLSAGLLSSRLASAQTEDEIWPAGDNGPREWPPELDNPFWQAEMRYPEGGDPPPLDLFERLTCPPGSARLTITTSESGRWETSRYHPPEYAFDDYTASRWSSWDSTHNWIIADMDELQTVTRVYLIWETAFGADYDIEVSDDKENWTTAAEVRNGNGQADVIQIDNAMGRYVRMWGVRTGSQYGYSLYEFSICAVDGSDPGVGGAGGAGGTGGAAAGGSGGMSPGGTGGTPGMQPTAGSGGTPATPPVGMAGGTGGTMISNPPPGAGGTVGTEPVNPPPIMTNDTNANTQSGCSVSSGAQSRTPSVMALLLLGAGLAHRRRRRQQ